MRSLVVEVWPNPSTGAGQKKSEKAPLEGGGEKHQGAQEDGDTGPRSAALSSFQ